MNEMTDQDEKYEESWILYNVLDRYIGSRERVAVRRKLTVVREQFENRCNSHMKHFSAGSAAEGNLMAGSDEDIMVIDNNVMVMCPGQSTSIPVDSTTTVFMMRKSEGRPGYVKLELVNQGKIFSGRLAQCLVPVGDVLFISSEIYSRVYADVLCTGFNAALEQHGPASTFNSNQSYLGVDNDFVLSFPCTCWPREANEWVSRTRLYEWPVLDLRNQIVKGGCHLVPVGDKTSPDTFLQWRVSFVCAERKLMYSLSHVHFLIYGLLKYFIKQISHRFEQRIGDKDIISSYIIKTILFYAVESTPYSLWQERNTFYCFMLCFNLLIACVNAGHCSNYFIESNNMFLGKVYGENQQKLLRILTELRDMKWKCLSVGTFIQPSIGARINSVRNGEWEYILPSPAKSELERDWEIFAKSSYISNEPSLPITLKLLSKSESDIDEFIAYIATVQALSVVGMDTYKTHVTARGNKEKYKYLRKCKELLRPLSSACTSPGLLTLATYHYQTGNYIKSLEMCRQVVSSFKVYVGHGATFKDVDRYARLYCGRGYSLLHKSREVCAWQVMLNHSTLSFCPPQLHKEMAQLKGLFLFIPPLPYAVFLSFLCFHDLGDTKRRDTALTHLRALKYDEEQGVCVHWIVHNILGTCYEMVGDTRRALREYSDSLGVQGSYQFHNTARDSIERLRHLQ